MIDHTPSSYIWIRLCIFIFNNTIPVLVVLCIFLLTIPSAPDWLTHTVEALAIVETAFYILVYLPRKHLLQRPAVHPELLPRSERRRLFKRAHDSLLDAESYLSKWFSGAPLSDIKRENVKQFFCWAFLSKAHWGPEDEDELEEYADAMEQALDQKLDPGWGKAVPLRLTLDPIEMKHRPLLWYSIVALLDTLTSLILSLYRFKFRRLPLSQSLTVFPRGPLAFLSQHPSPSNHLSYWHRKHTSPTRLPVVFIHGIGVGLWPYIPFLIAINASGKSADGDIGILVIELMPVSSRITGEVKDKNGMVVEILSILNAEGFSRFVLVSHSYGSVIATHMIHHHLTSNRISSMVFVDPVTILLHFPDVAYNFTRRKPRRANEWMLWYFASMDMGVAHTLARHFFWAENELWKEDLAGRNVTVALSGRDLIVNTRAVGRYLMGTERPDDWVAEEGSLSADMDDWTERSWKGEGIDLLWFEELDHAQIFEKKRSYGRVVEVVRAYCADIR